MYIKTRNIKTPRMAGNIDLDGCIFDILVENYGQQKVLLSDFDTDKAIYSNGFISAVERGLIPTLDLFDTDSYRAYNELEEYHHVIIGDRCYNVYFKKIDAE
jgi:hypothetical protein